MKAQPEKMQDLVRQWKQSGMSQASFARKNELTLHSLRYWIKKSCRPEMPDSGFIQICGSTPAPICLHYPNGVELMLPSQTPAGFLLELICFEDRCSR
jgi:hypothetical protein